MTSFILPYFPKIKLIQLVEIELGKMFLSYKRRRCRSYKQNAYRSPQNSMLYNFMKIAFRANDISLLFS